MDKEKIQSYINNPGELIFHPDTDFLDRVIEEYPYFQTAHLLRSVALNQVDSIFFNRSLHKTALYAGDRSAFRRFLSTDFSFREEEKPVENKPLAPAEKSTPSGTSPLVAKSPQPKNQEQETGKTVEKEKTVTARKKTESEKKSGELTTGKEKPSVTPEKKLSGKHSFTEWLNTLGNKETKQPEEKKEKQESLQGNNEKWSKTPTEPKKVAELNLLDQFISTAPKISRPKAKIYNPVNMANKSVEEDPDLATETLAKIHAMQGNYKKAIKIYEKLALQYPEKFNYFASRIEQLKNKEK